MSAPGPEHVMHRPCTIAPAPRRARSRDGRHWLGLRAILVAVQVACWTLVGWTGATLTLLPLALRGAPAGRRPWEGEPRPFRLLEPVPPREALPP